MKSRTENILITPEMAFEILSESEHQYQRPLRRTQVDFLVKEIKAGRFVSNTISICVLNGHKRYLVNGQHTLNAIFESGISLNLPVQTFDVKSEEEVAFIYGTIDKQKKRTIGDTLRAHDMEGQLDMSYTSVTRYARAAKYLLGNFKSSNDHIMISEMEIMDFMRDWAEYARKYITSIEMSGGLRVTLERSDVFSIGLITSRYSKKADEFWHYVATDDGLRVGDPRKTLHNYLSDTGLSGGNIGFSRKKKIIRLSESIRCVVLAWNAFVDNKQMKILRVSNPTLPFTIKDTPYKNLV